ncbi:Cell surface glycoprotein 1 [Labeo rohita]|uniref:Cell surface glycoprotein 1 n=1 Tax=Labeo rohita TaxID=84645 RepID=A0ABQ8ME09_LABRO|nr:Cell surface glycoprotein 1 [Labeo rohita]
MDNPAVLLLLLEQRNRFLVDHTRDFVHLVTLTHYPDSSLCTFYRAGLNIATKAQLSGEGPRESFADYIEWVLVSCRSSLTAEDDTSPTQDPDPSQPAPRHAEFEPEPTADDEPEPEPYTSDQVRVPATTTTTGECKMEQVRTMESPAHCTTAGGELDNDSGDLIDFSTEVLENNSGDLIDFFTEISTCHVIPACMESPPTLPLLPMSTSVCAPLSPDRPSAHPQCSTCAVGSPRVCQLPSVSGLEDPSSPPPASESRTPPQPSDPAAPPRLSVPSSPSSPVGPPAPPGSLPLPGSLALRLRLGLLHQRLRLRRSAPWSRQPFLHHGSSLRRLHRGSTSWLRSGSLYASPAPGSSCFLLGSSHLRHPPGLCYVLLNCLSGHGLLNSPIRHGLLNRPPTLLFFCMLYGARRAYSEGGVMSHLCLFVFWFLPLSPPVDLSVLV